MHAGPPLLRLTGVGKRFGDVVANDEVSLDVRAGQVHCLLGENGAGKSTLIGMLAGMQQPDSGSIEIDGAPCRLLSPAASISQGIGVVYQHSALVPTMTVLENLMLGERDSLRLDRKRAELRLTELGGLLGSSIEPGTPVGELGLGQQQQLELAKAMWARPRLLILDEPTSMLTGDAVAELFESVRRLTADGVAVLLVTHKLDEALTLGDAVTVLRGGRVALRLDTDDLSSTDRERLDSRILEAMFGDYDGRRPTPEQHPVPPEDRTVPEVVLGVDGLSVDARGGRRPLEEVSLTVGAGEIVGVAGIDGHGQRELAEAIAGQLRPSEGSVLLDGRDITRATVRERQRLGVRYVTDDRLHEGIVGRFSVALNLALKRVGERPIWRLGQTNRRALRDEAVRLIDAYDIRTPSPEARVSELSGGNIQKILLARELSSGARFVVFNKPSYGLDLRTVRRVREEILAFARGGGAVLLISTDLDELVELTDRIVVLSHGRLVGEVAVRGAGHEPAREAEAARESYRARPGAQPLDPAGQTSIRERVGQLIVSGVPG